jgi:hypothetical protein
LHRSIDLGKRRKDVSRFRQRGVGELARSGGPRRVTGYLLPCPASTRRDQLEERVESGELIQGAEGTAPGRDVELARLEARADGVGLRAHFDCADAAEGE